MQKIKKSIRQGQAMQKIKRSFVIKAITGILSVCMLTPTLSVSAEHEGILTDRAEHTDLDFSEYEYGRMLEADFDTFISGREDLFNDPDKTEELQEFLEELDDWIIRLRRNYEIASIYSDLDADDEYWDDEVKYYTDLYVNVLDKLWMMLREIAEAPNAEVLREYIDDEDDWQEILDYEPMTQEYKDLVNRETELTLQYDVLFNKEYTAVVDGTDYTMDGLQTAFSQGAFDYQKYFQGVADILQARNQEMGELFLELVDVRTQIAKLDGYDNYADYMYKEGYDRDYEPDELDEYRDQVKQYFVPLFDELYAEAVSSDRQHTLQDFYSAPATEEDCLDTLRTYLPRISPDMLVSLQYMEDHHTYDITPNPEKAPGAYTLLVAEYNSPFLFNCASGDLTDIKTIIHEFGHYNAGYFMTADSWDAGVNDLDIAEIHSQGLEMLFLDFADEIFGEYAEISRYYTWLNFVYAAVEGAKEDAFQYAIYSDPDNLTVEKINEIYYEVCNEYGCEDDFDSNYLGNLGYMDAGQICEWVEIVHTFQNPMYYISYSVSISVVFELYDIVLQDRDAGIDAYLRLVEEEFQNGFQETLENAGLNNPIVNPRFDLYAEDIRYGLGLTEEAEGGTSGSEGNEGGEDENITEPENEDGQNEDSGLFASRDDDDNDRNSSRRDRDRDRDDKEDKMIPIIILCVTSGLFLAGVIVIIVSLCKGNKKGKRQEYVAKQIDYVPQTQQQQLYQQQPQQQQLQQQQPQPQPQPQQLYQQQQTPQQNSDFVNSETSRGENG